MNDSKKKDDRFQKRWVQSAAVSSADVERTREGPRRFRFRFTTPKTVREAVAAIKQCGFPVEGRNKAPNRKVRTIVWNDGAIATSIT